MSDQERKQFDEWRQRFIAEHGLMPTEADAWQARAALAQQAVPDGWKLTAVSDGDVRVYGPDKETWLIRKDCGEGFYDFIYRFFEAMIAAAPAAPQAEQQDERDLAINAETCAVCGEGKALLVRSCSCCGSLYAGSAEMRENQKQAGQAPAVGAGQWVPVSERLPERNVEVLVALSGISIPSTGQYTGSSKDRDPNGWCYPAENNGTCDDGSDPVVTHWMPLPDPPKSNVPVQPMGGA